MSSQNTNLNGKVAVVTGAASGIGKQIALTLSEAGAAVAIADLNQDGANAVAEEIKQGGGKAIGVAMDVTSEEAVNRALKGRGGMGSVDMLVSNAGIQIVAPIEKYAFSDWKKMLAIHVDGAFLTTKAAIKHMYKDDRGGIVIYMGSVHSHEASKLKSAYVAAKHGCWVSRAWSRRKAAHDVRAHVVCPGFVRTPLVDKQIPEQAKELGISEEDVISNVMLRGTVDGEFTTVEDVAKTVRSLRVSERRRSPGSRSSSATAGQCNKGAPMAQRNVKRARAGTADLGDGEHAGAAAGVRTSHPIQCRATKIALVLQGGGALGAYQAGVYQGLAEAGIQPNWIAGISIGALNTAIIAGNAPEERVERLRGFWETICHPAYGPPWPGCVEHALFNSSESSQGFTAMQAHGRDCRGAEGLFFPRFPPPMPRFRAAAKRPVTTTRRPEGDTRKSLRFRPHQRG